MTIEYDNLTDTLWVAISEPASPCVYVESETAGVLLRVEKKTGIIRGFEISVFKRRNALGAIVVPEINDPTFESEWVAQSNKITSIR